MDSIERRATQGWDSVRRVFEKLYPDQKNPLHFGTLIPWRLGGDDPLDGISIYEGNGFYHFVTFGFSELYEKEWDDLETSGNGFELTMCLKMTETIDEEEIQGVCGILQSLARYVFQENTVFQPYEYIYTGQAMGMDVKEKSKLTGFITVPDPYAKEIQTPNGKVAFIMLVGMTDKELRAVLDKRYSVKEMVKKLGHTITDYGRGDLI